MIQRYIFIIFLQLVLKSDSYTFMLLCMLCRYGKSKKYSYSDEDSTTFSLTRLKE